MEVLRYVYLCILAILAIYSVFTLLKGGFYIKLYAIVTLGVEVIGLWYLKTNHFPLGIMFNFYSIFEIWIWLKYIFSITNQKSRTVWIYLTIYLLLFSILINFNIFTLNHSIILVNNVFVSLLIIFYFYDVLRLSKDLDNNFWITIGGLFYHTGCLILSSLIQHVQKFDINLATTLFHINTSLNILFYSFVLYGLLQSKKPYMLINH